MNQDDFFMLNQLSVSLEQTVKKMEKAYAEKNSKELKKLKILFLNIQEKIAEISK
jgi:hypothetical protein